MKDAAIHENGGVTPPHEILPDKARASAFAVGGKQTFAAHVNLPAITLPERSYLRSSLAEMTDEIKEELAHVEGHAAAFMRQTGITEGTLKINNPNICRRCMKNLPTMLPAGGTLRVMLARAPFIAELRGENGFELVIGLGRDLGCVEHRRIDGDLPYLMAISLRPSMKFGEVEFLTANTPTPIDAKYILAFEN